jgi:ABC-type Zn uptake system ZnuABC Zn-binding protein ZnuA
MIRSFLTTVACFVGLLVMAGCDAAEGDDDHAHGGVSSEPIRIVATTTDLADLARRVGTDHVRIHTLVGGEDHGHYIDTTPAMVTRLSRADLLILTGGGMEREWIDELIGNARNPTVAPGGDGHIIAADSRQPLEHDVIDAASVHPEGNPHFMVDPVEGVRVAARLRDRFTALRPAFADDFETGYAAIRDELAEQLYGRTIAGRIADGEATLDAFAIAAETGAEDDVLPGASRQMAGHVGAFRELANRRVVTDHDLWPHIARRYGFEVVGSLEPSAGVEPTMGHLQEVIATMNDRDVGVILAAIFFDPRHGRFVASQTGAIVVGMAHQTGSRDWATSYAEMTAGNAQRILEALRRAGREGTP